MNKVRIDLSRYVDKLNLKNKLMRLIWNVIYLVLFRPFVGKFLMPWRKFLLIFFGAKMDKNVHVYASARIWGPWNLEMGENSCLASFVDCYNVDKIRIMANTIISKKLYLGSVSCDISDPLGVC